MNFFAPGIGHEAAFQNGLRPHSERPASAVLPPTSDGHMVASRGHAPRDLTPDALLGVPDAMRRMRGMFLEMPGTRMSVADASRLVGLPPLLCAQVLDTLVEVRFLRCGSNGVYTVNGAA
jgi:hypothetical protein